MPVKKYSTRISQVEAMQMQLDTETGITNVNELALWCRSKVEWEYDTETREMKGSMWLDVGTPMRIEPTNWVLKHLDNDFEVLTNPEFRRKYDAELFNGPRTCRYCLSDPANTPMADPHEKKCPACGVRYNGPQRTKEYLTLVSAGLVTID